MKKLLSMLLFGISFLAFGQDEDWDKKDSISFKPSISVSYGARKPIGLNNLAGNPWL